MLIVSQDKRMFFNLDNVAYISVTTMRYYNKYPDKFEPVWQIKIYTTNDEEFDVANYKTEERATEVLLQIAHTQGSCNTYEIPKE